MHTYDERINCSQKSHFDKERAIYKRRAALNSYLIHRNDKALAYQWQRHWEYDRNWRKSTVEMIIFQKTIEMKT